MATIPTDTATHGPQTNDATNGLMIGGGRVDGPCMSETPVLTADQFLALVQEGRTKEANREADRALRADDPSDRTLAWAALVYLHTGRFDAAKKLGKKLEDSPSVEALWARAALAIAFKPGDAPSLLTLLHPHAGGSPEYALLAGVSAYQQGLHAEGDHWMAGVQVHPQSVFATAGALGMRRRANQGLGRRLIQVGLAVGGTLVLGLIGLALGLLAAAAINRSALQSKTTGAANALLSVKPPRETHSNRESLRMFGFIGATFIVMLALIFAAVALT